MSAYCPEACPDADACVVGRPCAMHPEEKPVPEFITIYTIGEKRLTKILEQALTEHRLGAATGQPWYKREGGSRLPKNYTQTYACKCKGWEGAHGEHTNHVIDVVKELMRAEK